MTDKGWGVGTPLWFVPIRFWETTEPETGHVAEHIVVGEIKPDDPNSLHVYAFHDGYGHNVYMTRATSFDTRDARVVFRLNTPVSGSYFTSFVTISGIGIRLRTISRLLAN